MTHESENNVLIINKQELIQAALELEKQEALHSCLLFHCLDQLEDIHRKLSLILDRNEASIARNAFLNVLMDQAEWDKILTERHADWHAEARQILTQLP